MKRLVTTICMVTCAVLMYARVVYAHTFTLQEQRDLGITGETEVGDAIYALSATNPAYSLNSNEKDFAVTSFQFSSIDGSITLKKNMLSLEMLDTASSQLTVAHLFMLSGIDDFFHKHGRNKVCATLTHSTQKNEYGRINREDWKLYDEFAPPFADPFKNKTKPYEIKVTLEINWRNILVRKAEISKVDSLKRDGKIYMKGDTIRIFEEAQRPRLEKSWEGEHKGLNRLTVECWYMGQVIDREVIYQIGKDPWSEIIEKRLHKLVNKIAWSDVDKICPMRSCSRFKQDYEHKSNAITFSNWQPYWTAFYPGRGVYPSRSDDDWYIQVDDNCKYNRGYIRIGELERMGLCRAEYLKLPYEELQERRREAGLKTY